MNKHPDDYIFGMDKDIQDRMRAKFDPDKQAQAQTWIEEILGVGFEHDSFHENLKDGVLLCQLLNKIKPKTCRKIYKGGKQAFQMRENIVKYLNGCQKLGMNNTDCFVSQDLYEGDNMVAVIDQIFALGAVSRNVDGFEGPYLGVKHSDENKRVFTKEQIAESKKIVPLQNAGSIEVEKSKGTDKIVMYAKAGIGLGKASNVISQQNAGSIEVKKSTGTDHIVKYGKVGQEMGKSVGGISQQNAGSIEVKKGAKTDHIVKYGIVGQEMGKSVGGVSQQNAGSIAIEKEKGTDHIVKYGKVGQEMGKSAGGVSQINQGSLTTSKEKKLDSISRALN